LPFAEAVRADHHHRGLWWSWVGETIKKVGMGLVLALVSLVIAALAPNRLRRVIATTRRRPLLSLLSGLLALVVALMASVVLVVTIVGIPLVPLLFVAVALALVLGQAAVAALIGEAMPGRRRHERSALRCIVVGVTVLTLLSILPLGGFFLWLLVMAGLGSVILSRVGATSPSE
jgi:MFS family permease